MAVQEKPATALDPITYEVVRNRLWSINDQQALLTARISGSPTIYESNDFNAAIMDREGACLFLGVYVTFFGTSLTQIVKGVMEQFGDDIHEGDMFITNDPWVGALHQSDMAVVAPVFHEGEHIAWTGITMHEDDVGGPVPGSFVVGATEVFGESTLIPPIKLREGGEWRTETERLLLRNTRTPKLNALNIRARVAGQTVAHERILAIVERYGRDAFLAVLQELRVRAGQALRSRLASLPDGVWSERMYIDHDGNDDVSYPVCLEMTKTGDRLIFDFAGTSKQAPGMVNCAWGGLEGGIMSAILPILCYDVPWTSGGLGDIIEIRSELGTINNAAFPAAVSMAPISAAWMSTNLVSACLGKMLASSEEYLDEAQACWVAGWHGIVIAGLNQRNDPMAGIFMDAGSGGGGARTARDGIDTGGLLTIISNALANVETNERHYPIIQLYRRQGADTGGAGRFRGGVGGEMAFTPHKNPIPIQLITFSTGCDYPAAPGMFGGQAGSLQRSIVSRSTDVWEQFGTGSLPQGLDQLQGSGEEILQPKDATVLNRGDVHHSFFGGGGGYGDPLERDLGDVQRDLDRALVTPEAATSVYGALLGGDGKIDAEASAARRDELRRGRIERSRPTGEVFGSAAEASPVAPAAANENVRRLGDAFLVEDGSLSCRRCTAPFGSTSEDPRRHALVERREITDLSPVNRYGRDDLFAVYSYCCPSCGLQVGSEVQLASEPQRGGDALR